MGFWYRFHLKWCPDQLDAVSELVPLYFLITVIGWSQLLQDGTIKSPEKRGFQSIFFKKNLWLTSQEGLFRSLYAVYALVWLTGTIWMQQILLLLEAEGDMSAISSLSRLSNADLIPWIELDGNRQAFIKAPSPRMRVTHLQYHLLPPALSQKKGKVSSSAVTHMCTQHPEWETAALTLNRLMMVSVPLWSGSHLR